MAPHWSRLLGCALLLPAAAATAPPVPRSATPALGRRCLLGAAAAAASAPPLATVAGAVGAAAALTGAPRAALAATALSRDQVAAKLSRVPTFVITNRQSEPYLIESVSGKRTGAFFLSPADAIEQLQQIREFDSAASLSVVPLDSVWFELPKDAAEAAKAAQQAAQPKAGTSSDLRLFRLAPSEQEVASARALLQAQRGSSAKLAEGGVPLFFANELQLEVEGTPQQPYYFRQADLEATWKQAAPDRPLPKLQVTSLALLFDGGVKPTEGAPPLLVAGSDAVAVVQRAGMSLDTSAGGGLSQEQADAPPPQPQVDPVERLSMTTPWGAGQPLRQGTANKIINPLGLDWLSN